MRILVLGGMFCFVVAGCVNDSKPMSTGDEIGGATVGTSFPGSSGANAKNSSGGAIGTGATGSR